MPQESIKNSHTSNITFAPELTKDFQSSIVKFKGICFKQNSVSFFHKKVINLFISYRTDAWSKDLNSDFTPVNCLFGAVKLTKNADPDKYKCNNYGIGFDSRSQFSWTDGSVGKNIILFGVDNSSSMHIDGRKKILVLSKDQHKA